MDQLSAHVYLFQGDETNAGVILTDEGVILIDTGPNAMAGDAICQELKCMGERVCAIINTHGHLDHYGANRRIMAQYSCEVYALGYEALCISDPHVWAYSTSGGSRPLWYRLRKFEAAACPCTMVQEGSITINGVTLTIISLPGHSPGSACIAYDNILFCGDALLSEHILHNKFPFFTDAGQQLDTLRRIKTTQYMYYVPGHGNLIKDPIPLCNAYSNIIENLAERILRCTEHAVCEDDIVAIICNERGIDIRSNSAYSKIRIPIAGILNWLYDCGAVIQCFDGNRLLWKSNGTISGIDQK